MAAMLQGHELGIGPMASLSQIAVINGKPCMSAQLMRALVHRAGHDLWFEAKTNTKVTIAGRRAEWPEDRIARVTWTMDDAKTEFGLWDSFAPFRTTTDVSLFQINDADSTRLDLLAYRFYGDVNLWWVIAEANNLINVFDELSYGMFIRIPSRAVVDQYLRGGVDA